MAGRVFVDRKRIVWIEALRAIAMLMVVIPHFIAAFCPEAFVVWQTHSLFLKGVNGKHGVAIFCVLIGYFSSQKSGQSVPTYLIRRYMQFAINICIVLLVFSVTSSILSKAGIASFVKSIANSIIEAALFKSSLNPTLWCVREMFFGSLICFILGNYCRTGNKCFDLTFVLLMGLFLYFVNVWIAISALGACLRVFSEIEVAKSKRWMLCVLFVLAIPFLYRRGESNSSFMFQGLSCCFFMYVCMSFFSMERFKGWPKWSFLAFLGNISFYVFLWHTPVNMIIMSLGWNLNLWVLFAVSFFCSIVLAIIQYWMNKKWIVPSYKKIQINTI